MGNLARKVLSIFQNGCVQQYQEALALHSSRMRYQPQPGIWERGLHNNPPRIRASLCSPSRLLAFSLPHPSFIPVFSHPSPIPRPRFCHQGFPCCQPSPKGRFHPGDKNCIPQCPHRPIPPQAMKSPSVPAGILSPIGIPPWMWSPTKAMQCRSPVCTKPGLYLCSQGGKNLLHVFLGYFCTCFPVLMEKHHESQLDIFNFLLLQF